MQVGNLNAANVARTYTTQVGGSGAGAARSAAIAYGAQARPRTDSVSVSSTRMEVMQARDMAASQPDVRADKVAALKQQIASGAYQVDTRALAAKMLGH
jgi:negative regulator of flagellin synthesis FlgM